MIDRSEILEVATDLSLAPEVVEKDRNGEFRPAAHAVLDVLRSKCAFKRIEVPTFASLASATEELLGDWQAMLGHQLPMLPPFESYWAALPEFFDWLQGGAPSAEPATAPIAAEETVFRPAVGTLRRQGLAGSSHLEIIRFAASNHLCVDLGYQRSIRRIEPYSLRRTQAGDIVLYAVKTDTGEPRRLATCGDRRHHRTVTALQQQIPAVLLADRFRSRHLRRPAHLRVRHAHEPGPLERIRRHHPRQPALHVAEGRHQAA